MLLCKLLQLMLCFSPSNSQESIVIEDGIISFIGSDAEAETFMATHKGNCKVVDLNGRLILPRLIIAKARLVL